MRTKRFLLAGLLPALLLGGAAFAQDVPLDVELGYRWTDVTGNREMFRSQLNEREGLQLRSLSYGLGDIRDNAAIDHFRIDAADLGIGPSSLVRVEAGRTGFWKLNASYRRAELYSNLPTIANPFLEAGQLDSQHSFDRARSSVDVDLELFSGRKVRPLLGYSYSLYDGPGLTTYTVGEDDFKLSQSLKQKEQEFRVGVAFDAGPLSGQVVQGWRTFRGEETIGLASGAGAGNNSTTILDVPVTLSSFGRTTNTDVDTPVTSAVVTGKLGSAVRLTGTYVRAKADGDDESHEALTGNLVSFGLLRYFKSLSELSTASTDALSWRGGIRADIHISDGFDVSAGFTRRSRELNGYGLLNDLFGTTTTFSGLDPKDITTILSSKTRLVRDEDVYDARASLKVLGPFSLRVGYSENRADIDVRNDEAEIVLPGHQGGRYERRVRAFEGGLLFKLSGLSLGVDYVRQNADEAVVRTDYIDRDRVRVRGAWEPVTWFRIGATAEESNTSNDDAGYGLDGKSKTYAGDLELSPLKWVRVRFGAGRFEADSSIGYRLPQSWVNATSVNRERGDTLEGGITLDLKPISLEGLYRRFENDGSFPYELDRARVRADLEFSKLIGIAAEWDLDDYTEAGRSYGTKADYRANRYGLYLRIHP